MSEQLRLAFEHHAARGAEDFMPAPCNREALAWLARWPDWPSPALVLHGPPGCGKSHLGADLDDANGRPLARGALRRNRASTELGARRRRPGGRRAALLSIYNRLHERRGHLLLTARRPVGAWTLRLPDLASRLRAAPAVAIGAPDDALLGAVLLKLFADRQLVVFEAVIEYLVRHMERSFDAARRVVAELDAASLRQQRPITVALARGLLEQAAAAQS